MPATIFDKVIDIHLRDEIGTVNFYRQLQIAIHLALEVFCSGMQIEIISIL